ncbi:MAG TPA: hypothetical protein VNN80_05470, partial [Polyangiaceae bacterium]|nr:hypothetical protein [Polyangiaceae bacterium]
MSSDRRRGARGARIYTLPRLVITSAALLHCGSEASPSPSPSVGAPGASAASVGGSASGGNAPVAVSGGSDGSGVVSAGGAPSAIDPSAGNGAGGDGAGGSSGAGESGGGAGSGTTSDAGPDNAGTPRIAFDWNGVVGTGQSLSVGEPGAARDTPAGTARSTQQPFGNLKLSTGALPWPVDPNDSSLTLVPLVEPLGRFAPTYPSSWPDNIAFNGETPHAAMANQLTTLVSAATGAEFVGVHGAVGENGQCLSFLVKGAMQVGVNGHAYEATLIETRAITRLAQAAGKTYGVAAITVTHGECDAGNAQYNDQLFSLYSDYAIDLPAITGQSEPPLMIVSQQNSSNDRAASTLAAWRVGVEHPEQVVCSGPKYQYPYTSDALHLIVDGYQQLGEKYAQVYYERVVLGSDWQPLQPTSVDRDGRVITVHFHVPVPPLAWEESFQLPHQANLTEWSAGR